MHYLFAINAIRNDSYGNQIDADLCAYIVLRAAEKQDAELDMRRQFGREHPSRGWTINGIKVYEIGGTVLNDLCMGVPD